MGGRRVGGGDRFPSSGATTARQTDGRGDRGREDGGVSTNGYMSHHLSLSAPAVGYVRMSVAFSSFHLIFPQPLSGHVRCGPKRRQQAALRATNCF